MKYFAIGRAYWRPYEKQACEKYFDETYHADMSDVLIWRHNTENVTAQELKYCTDIEQSFNGIVINPMSSFNYTRDKQACFDTWSKNNISIPTSFEFTDKKDFYNKLNIDVPFLLRLNDRATGECTYLVETSTDIESNLDKLINDYNSKKNHSTKMICVEFIDTKINNKNISFRIHVAGNKVISGYARLSNDWLALSPKFTIDMKVDFIEQQKRLYNIINNNREQIINAVHVLGLHHQGVDVIAGPDDKIYFLEVQPFYFSGRPKGVPNPTNPPFFNPTKPPELIDWLITDKDNLSKEVPFYFENWLNKENHFDLCYRELREYADSRL